ncbi:hypothetical protein TNCT_531761 [Trichonephila clavata]|uniref:Uncharacterized protein n=1 Tax=Trichonephila clavata TaxID=2740835 RepID=A0A8X6KAK6_TRICU|nr:hypothetical protein TNCT_531761 [Trichonephila clavata]
MQQCTAAKKYYSIPKSEETVTVISSTIEEPGIEVFVISEGEAFRCSKNGVKALNSYSEAPYWSRSFDLQSSSLIQEYEKLLGVKSGLQVR